MKYLVIILIWAAYCFIHSFMISTWFTGIVQRLIKKYYAFYRLFFVLLSTILLIPLIRYTVKLDHEIIFNYSPALNVVRYVLMISGVLVFAKAFFIDYDVLHFVGIRQAMNFKKTSKEPADKELKNSGLLGIVRHPMYSALIVVLWCHSFTIADVVVNAVLTIYIVIGTILEERKLLLEFGDSYANYQKEVPMLIPFIRTRISKYINHER